MPTTKEMDAAIATLTPCGLGLRATEIAAAVLAAAERVRDEDTIRDAIDTGGGQRCDVDGVLLALDRRGFHIVRKDRA